MIYNIEQAFFTQFMNNVSKICWKDDNSMKLLWGSILAIRVIESIFGVVGCSCWFQKTKKKLKIKYIQHRR